MPNFIKSLLFLFLVSFIFIGQGNAKEIIKCEGDGTTDIYRIENGEMNIDKVGDDFGFDTYAIADDLSLEYIDTDGDFAINLRDHNRLNWVLKNGTYFGGSAITRDGVSFSTSVAFTKKKFHFTAVSANAQTGEYGFISGTVPCRTIE